MLQPATSPPSRALTTAALAAQQLLALADENQLLRERIVALEAERTPTGVLVQPVQRLAYTVREAAVALGTSRSRVLALIHAGQLDAIQDGQVWFVPVAAIERWLERTGPATPTPWRAKGARR